MKITTVALATAFALTGSIAVAQSGMTNQPTTASKKHSGTMQNRTAGTTTGTSRCPGGDASTAPGFSAAPVDATGTGTEPGNVRDAKKC